MSSSSLSPVYRFGLFEVDSRSGELRKQGLRLRVRGRPIDILLLLVERPGEVVTRDELRSRLWPADTFVDFDHGLNSAINRLRDALGESADNPRFVETVPRRGYRFIAPVQAVQPPARPAPVPSPEVAGVEAAHHPAPLGDDTSVPVPPGSPGRASRAGTGARWRLPLVAAGLAAAVLGLIAGPTLWRARGTAVDGRLSIAVLPFANLSGDAEQEYLSDGFTEEMITELGMLQPDRLTVIGRTTSMLYKGARKSIGQIGDELGVMYLLEGSVRRAGPRMRITAQLLDAKSMTHLWADSYERDVGDVLAVQKDVARRIASALALALAPPSAADSPAAPASFTAYELLMRGRFFREQATEEGARRAIDYYERAITADPQYAAAHAALADAYRLLGAPGWEVEAPAVLLPRAKAAAERALALDPSSPEARAVLAMIKFNFDWDLAGAEREILEALRLNPSFSRAHQYYSSVLTAMARPDDAIAAARRAIELDPLSATAGTSLGVRYYYAQRPDDGIAQFTKTLELTPGFAVAHWGLAQCFRLQGRWAEQIDQLQSAVQLSGDSAYMRSQLAYGYAAAGDRARADALRQGLLAEQASRYVAPYHIALVAAGLGETPEAVRWLERAYEDRSGWLVFLPVEPEFDAMRQAPAFQRLLARVAPQR